MLRHDQDALLRWVLGALGADCPRPGVAAAPPPNDDRPAGDGYRGRHGRAARRSRSGDARHAIAAHNGERRAGGAGGADLGGGGAAASPGGAERTGPGASRWSPSGAHQTGTGAPAGATSSHGAGGQTGAGGASEAGELPPLSLERFARAGLATGLTALIATLAAEGGQHLPSAWQPYLAEQMAEVAARQRRFAVLVPEVLSLLGRAGVGAVPVKGAVLAPLVWPWPQARPMADVDLIVEPGDRARAHQALISAGFVAAGTNPWEDTFLAWGDGTVGRTDGESAAHNGKVEVHPGYVERLHNYLVSDGGVLLAHAAAGKLHGVDCRRLAPGAFAAHVVGHLAASVVRAEVRAVNIVDAVMVLRQLPATEWGRFADLARTLDPRLVAPGLWAVARYQRDVVPADLLTSSLARLPRAATAQLRAVAARDVLRDPASRTTWRWRAAFTTDASERARMARQFVWPAPTDLAGAPAQRGLAGRRAARMMRLVRAVRRPTRPAG